MNAGQFDHRLYQVLKRLESTLTVVARYIRFNHLLFAAVFFLGGASFWLAYEFRFDFEVPASFNAERLLILPYLAVFKLTLFYALRMHVTNWRYVGLSDLPRLVLYGLIGSCASVLVRVASNSLVVPRGVILIDFLLTLVLIGGARVGIRYLRETTRAIIGKGESANAKNAVIVGAGDSGEMIAREIVRNPDRVSASERFLMTPQAREVCTYTEFPCGEAWKTCRSMSRKIPSKWPLLRFPRPTVHK